MELAFLKDEKSLTVTVKGMTATYTVKVVEDPNTEPPTEPETEPVTEPETEAPTDEVTEAPTAPVTEEPTDAPTEAETAPTEKKGCGANLMTLSAVMLIAASAVALKKKED